MNKSNSLSGQSRREFLAGLGAALGTSVVGLEPALGAAGNQKNILIIIADDFRPLHTWPGAKIPRIRELESLSTTFEDAHCASPICQPSRASLFTGISPHRSGCYDNKGSFRQSTAPAALIRTLPQYLKESFGYHTISIGKSLHLVDAPSWSERFPSDAWPRFQDPKPPEPRPKHGMATGKDFDWWPLDVPTEAMGDWKAAETTRTKLMNPPAGKPWFMTCGMYRPHLPWYVPRKYFDMFPLEQIWMPPKGSIADLPPIGRMFMNLQSNYAKMVDSGQLAKAIQGYLASAAFSDEMIGRVVDAYKASPQRNNTILAFWSDHGFYLGEDGGFQKWKPWERATRTYLSFIAPGLSVTGAKVDSVVSALDVFPTVCDLLGLPHKPGLDGESIARFLTNPSEPPRSKPVLTCHEPGTFAVRTDKWTLIKWRNGEKELYDRVADPHEETNLIKQAGVGAVVEDLSQWLPNTWQPAIPK